jgi:hypothetical protein
VTISTDGMRLVRHDGEKWLAIVTSSSACEGDRGIGVLFTAQTSARRVVGRLRGVPPGDFNQASPDQLRAALAAALSGDDT